MDEKPRFQRSRSVNLLSALAFMLLFGGVGIIAVNSSQAAGTPQIASGIAGKCLDDKSNLTADGSVIDIWTCNGLAAQRWTISGDHVLVNGKCLRPSNGNSASGTLMVLWTCYYNNYPSEEWTFTNHTMKNVKAGLCLDDPSSSTNNGTQLQLYACNGTNAQIWISGTYTPPSPPPTPKTPTPTPNTPTPTPHTPTPVPTHTPARTPTPNPGGGGGGVGSTPAPVPAPATPPDPPGNFAATVTGTNAVVELSWLAPADTLGIADYSLERSLDQSNWDTLSSTLTSTSFEDQTVGFSVHYYYRVKAQDSAGNVSGYAFADVDTPDFKASIGSGTATNYVGDNHNVVVTVPAGAIDQDADCSVTQPAPSLKGVSNLKLVVGPYQLVCKSASGDIITTFNQPLAWTLVVKGKLGGLQTPHVYTADDTGKVTLVQSAAYDKSAGNLTFSSTTSDQVLALAAIAPGLPWNLIAIVMLFLGAGIGVAVLILHKKQKQGYDEYLRQKYYNL